MGILGNILPSGNHTCPYYNLSEDASEPIFGNMTFYHFNLIFSGACAAFSSIVVFALMVVHATHLSRPNEQIKIMKICLLIPLFSIFSFLSILSPKSYVYLSPWLYLVESIAIGAFFLLLCEYISESGAERDVFFAALVVADKKAANGQGGGLPWYRKRWIMIFQYPVVSLLVAVATCITQAAGVYCQYESEPYFAKLWLELARTISEILALLSILAFWVALRKHGKSHKTLGKLLAFKSVVFWMFILSIVFWILSDANLLKTSGKMAYADLNIGLPNLLTCVFMVPISAFFPVAYTCRPYYISLYAAPPSGDTMAGALTPKRYRGGFLGWKAWVATLNPVETWKAVYFGFTMALEDRQKSSQQSLIGSRDGRSRYEQMEYDRGY